MVAVRLGLAAAVTAASALGACLEIPSYYGTTKVVYSRDDAGGALVAPPDIILHFSGDSGFHLPDQLQIDNVDVMGHASSPCWGESGTGFTVMPMPRVSGDLVSGGVSAMTHELQEKMTGPAVVQLKLVWSTRWNFTSLSGSTCSTNAKHTSGGTSTFTVFPDSHIVRHDVLTDDNPDAEPLDTGRCTCADMPKDRDDFIMSSYWAFDRAKFPTQVGLGSNGPTIPDSLPLGVNYDVIPYYDAVCFDGPGDQYQIASVWRVPDANGGPATNSAAVGFDTVVSHDVQKAGTTKLKFPWDVHGALFFEHSNCTAALKRTIEYTAPQALTISSGSSTISKLPSELDGIYGGDPGDPNLSPGIDADGPVKLSGGPSSSFVVWLKFHRPVIVPTASRTGAPMGWYVPQRVDDDQNWLVWVQDALQPGETITIQPNYY